MNTKQLRQKILDLAIRGKLVPQDPNDEPASLLLERVRAEKERLIIEGKIKRDKRDSAVSRGDDKSHYGNIPGGWTTAPISDLCIVNPRNVVDDSINVSFVPMALVEDGFSNHFGFEEKPWEKVKTGFTHFQEGDVGLAKITPCLENRKSVVFRGLTNEMGAGTTELHIFRPFCVDTILPEYLLWFFKSERFISGCIGAFSGAVGQQRVGKDYVAATYLPVPPFSEQRRIVVAVESAFAVIEEIERNKTDLQAAVTAAKSKILSLAIRGKLVSQDPNDEPASVLLERVRAEREALAKAGKIKRGKGDSAIEKSCDNSYYSALPESWEICCLDDIGFTNIGLTYKPTDICDNGIPVLRSNNIQDGRLDLSDLVRVDTPLNENLELHEGDIIICARNGSRHLVGKCALVPELSEKMTFGAFMAVYRSICNDYVYYFLHTDNFRSIFQSEGISTQINQLTQAMIKQTVIPLPPIAEQRRIVTAIDEAFKQLDNITAMLA